MWYVLTLSIIAFAFGSAISFGCNDGSLSGSSAVLHEIHDQHHPGHGKGHGNDED